VLQCVAVCCSVLQCVAVCCSVLQCVAVCRNVWYAWRHNMSNANCIGQHTATHCITLPNTAMNRITLQHTATHCNTLQHIATHCNTLQHTASNEICKFQKWPTYAVLTRLRSHLQFVFCKAQQPWGPHNLSKETYLCERTPVQKTYFSATYVKRHL